MILKEAVRFYNLLFYREEKPFILGFHNGSFQDIVEPRELLELSKEAVSISPEKPYILLPYYKPLNDEYYDLLLRRTNGNFSNPVFCLDLVKEIGEPFKHYRSFGWLDFTTTKRNDRTPLGSGNFLLRNFDSTQAPYIQRSTKENWIKTHYPELYVHEDLRRLGVGTALITVARAILNELGVKTLVLSPIFLTEERNGFYRQVGVHFFGFSNYNLEGKNCIACAGAIPTKDTAQHPYIFK